MLFKKSKAVIAAVLSAAMASSTMIASMSASAAGTRSKAEAFGDSTYAERFLSLYDDVVTNGKANGYLSSEGIPYHAVEEVIVEAPDYGHVTTSEAMSYLVWTAAMRDNIAANHADLVSTGSVTNTNELAKAWSTMENLIPEEQSGFWTRDSVSAQYCGEYDTPDQCPGAWAGEADKTAENPIYKLFTSAYSGDKGLYLMNWLADVDNWYGFGGQGSTDCILINTFQRGEMESCWETVPQPCVEELKYGNSTRGIKGIFNRDENVAPQYAYTNAPDAEDRAIQGVYESTQWGVEDSSVSALASKMGDELRNNMYDKYYRKIGDAQGAANSWSSAAGDAKSSAHYLMNWYTSWGGALDGTWAWQIGCSHCHEFYQNPLAAYALVTDLADGMKASGAKDDYMTSLERQLEFYLWLQSSDGPIAGGATNSYKGRYETYPSGVSTFYGMMYVEHPVYADPGSNHWIGNQVWAVQRLAELYYWEKQNGDESLVNPGGMTMDAALEQILDKWVAWFLNNTVLVDGTDYYIPSNLNWSGQPDEWKGSSSANSGLTCEITGYGNTDLGCVSSLANTLIYYASAKGVTADQIAGYSDSDVGGSYAGGIDNAAVKAGSKTYTADSEDLGAVSLYLAKELLDREWELGRDDIGLSRVDHNGSFARMFAQTIYVPDGYQGEMPNGDVIKNGIKFLDIRSQYLDSSKCVGAKTSQEAIDLVKELQAAYEKDVAAGAKFDPDLSASSTEGTEQLAGFKNVAAVDLTYHRFWHAGDIMMALGAMANLYPDLTPDSEDVPPTEPTSETEEPSETEKPSENVDPSESLGATLYGDTDCNGEVQMVDMILLNKYLMIGEEVTPQGLVNADVNINGEVEQDDGLNILRACIDLITLPVK